MSPSKPKAEAPRDPLSTLAIDPKEALHTVNQRKWLILISAIAVGAAVGTATMRQPKIYRAVAKILIDPVLPQVLGEEATIDDLAEEARSKRAFYNTQYSIMTSRSVLREVAVRLKLENDDAFLDAHAISVPDGESRLEEIEETLHGLIRIDPAVQSQIVRVIVEDQDADRAVRIANAVGQVYIDHSLETRLKTTRDASKFLDQRVQEFRQKLEQAEKSLHEFRNTHKLVSVSLEDHRNMISASLGTLNEELLGTRTKLIALRSEKRVFENQRAKPDGLESVPRIAKNPVISELKTTMAELTKERVDLSTRYGAKHPKMVAVTNQIEDANARLRKEIALAEASLDNEIEGLKGQETALAAAMAESKNAALNLHKFSVDYSKLSRDFGTTKTMYESLLKRQAQADLGTMLKSNFVRWLETAEPDYMPVRPSVAKNAGLGVIMGAFLGLLAALAGLLLDTTVRSQADVEHLLDVPFLGVLPSIRDAGMKKAAKAKGKGPGPYSPDRDLYIVRNPKSAAAECARSLRTNLMFLGADHSLKKILLTSAGPAEGKSTSVIALGGTMAAQSGARVLIIDTDLRRPRLHRTFGVSGELGLTSVLLEENTLEDCIKSTEVVGLDILPCGPLPPNPAELLHTEKFAKLIEEIEKRYDRIIFDSPPVNAVTDAVILSQQVDGTILVVKSSKTAKDAIRKAARSLRDVNSNVVGVVLNDVDFDQGGYRYQQYYYHRYGYAYGDDKDSPSS